MFVFFNPHCFNQYDYYVGKIVRDNSVLSSEETHVTVWVELGQELL